MKIEWNRRDTTSAFYALLVLCGAIVFFTALNNFSQVTSFLYKFIKPIMPIFFGFVLAYILNPMMVAIEKLFKKFNLFNSGFSSKFKRPVSVLITYLITLAVIVGFFQVVLPQVAINITSMYNQISVYVGVVEELVYALLDKLPTDLLPAAVVEQITQFAGNATKTMIDWFAGSIPMFFGVAVQIGSGLISFFVAVVASIYLLFSKERLVAHLRKFLCAFLPKHTAGFFMKVARISDKMFGRFISGKLLDSLIIGILCFLGLSIMQMPNAVLVSFIIGITNIIPYFGPLIGAIPGFVLVAIVSPIQGIVFLIFILVLQQVDGNIIGPMILGDSVGLSPFWILTSIMLFGGVFGFVGMIIGVPTFGVIYELVKESVNVNLAKKGMPIATEEYLNPLKLNK